jgi:hypothetical protein
MRYIIFIAFILSITGCKFEKDSDSFIDSRDNIDNAEEVAIPEKTTRENYWSIENLAREIENSTYLSTYSAMDFNRTRLDFEEGTVRRKVILIGEGTDNEAFVSFEDEKPYEIYVYNDGPWHNKHDIKVGTSLEELVAVNGQAVQFHGFEWDYAGMLQIEDGQLASDQFTYYIATSETAADSIKEKFIGDRLFNSTEENVEKLDAVVSRLVYKF